MDKFDYVMHGKVFKYKDNSSSGQLKADVSSLLALKRWRAGRLGRDGGGGSRRQGVQVY